MDLVIDIINSSNISKELNLECASRIKYLNGVKGKNKSMLDSKQKSLEGLVIRSASCDNPRIKQAFDNQISRLVLEINDYENKIQLINKEIESLNHSTKNSKVTKTEMLSNRAVARNIIKSIIKSIEVDEDNDEIQIEYL